MVVVVVDSIVQPAGVSNVDARLSFFLSFFAIFSLGLNMN
jgi:hypothetical protein